MISKKCHADKIGFSPISQNLFVRFFRKFLRINYPSFPGDLQILKENRYSRTSVNLVWIFSLVFRFLGVWPPNGKPQPRLAQVCCRNPKLQWHVKYLSASCHRYEDIRLQKIRFQRIRGRIMPKPEVRYRKWRHRWIDAQFYDCCKFGNIRISQTRTVTRWKNSYLIYLPAKKHANGVVILCWELLTQVTWLAVTEVRIADAHLFASTWCPLVRVITTLY